MKTNKNIFASKKLNLVVQAALAVSLTIPMVAFAEDYDAATLTHPTNSIEVGVSTKSNNSAKFNEYTGTKNDTSIIGNILLRGGDAYNTYDGGNGTHRWDINGTNLGTTSQTFGGTISNQGKWEFGISYDELRHNITDTYQTPFQGTMGGNKFTLPQPFGGISTTVKPIGYSTAPGSNVLTPAQQADFNTQDVHTTRENTAFSAKYVFNPRWDVKFDFNHLAQSGAKLLGVAGDQANGSTTSPLLTYAGQTPLVLMNPTNYTTDTFNVALGWAGNKGFGSVGYFGSLFHDDYDSLSFNNPFYKAGTFHTGTSLYGTDVMSTMPSNDFHQLNLSGGYAFTPTTKLAGGFSRGRNTQNDSYVLSGLTANGFPQPSLDGLVVSTHTDLKLTNQTTKNLLLSVGFKYNKRDNQTASNSYKFNTINEAVSTTAYTTEVNAPRSNNKTQVEVAGDYRISQKQKVRLSYENEEINRWCNTDATCAQISTSKEDKYAVNYKINMSNSISLSTGYGYSNRTAIINPSYTSSFQSVVGFIPYFDASRNQQILKSGITLQPTEKLSLSVNSRYTQDKYDSTYGVQDGHSGSMNLDATYNHSETSSVSVYATNQSSSRNLTNLQSATASVATATKLNVPAGGTWTNTLKENDTTVGVGAKQSGLYHGKVELSGDVTYSIGNTDYGTHLNYANADTHGNTCSSAYYFTCGNLPTIQNTIVQVKLASSYKVDKTSTVKVGYVYQHLNSVDYLYNAYQYGSTPATLLPTNQQAPSYSANIVTVSYVFNF